MQSLASTILFMIVLAKVDGECATDCMTKYGSKMITLGSNLNSTDPELKKKGCDSISKLFECVNKCGDGATEIKDGLLKQMFEKFAANCENGTAGPTASNETAKKDKECQDICSTKVAIEIAAEAIGGEKPENEWKKKGCEIADMFRKCLLNCGMSKDSIEELLKLNPKKFVVQCEEGVTVATDKSEPKKSGNSKLMYSGIVSLFSIAEIVRNLVVVL